MNDSIDFTHKCRRKCERRHDDSYSISTNPNSKIHVEKYVLTLREQQVLLALSQGDKDQIIAEQLGLSHKTIKHHMRGIFFKLGTQNRTQTVVKAIKLGLIKL